MLHILGELSFILTYFFVASNKTTIYNNMASTKTKLHLKARDICLDYLFEENEDACADFIVDFLFFARFLGVSCFRRRNSTHIHRGYRRLL